MLQYVDALLRESAARWAAITNDPPQCPECDEGLQIQVTDWIAQPMEWRCRMCRHRFTYQPQAPSEPSMFWGRMAGMVWA